MREIPITKNFKYDIYMICPVRNATEEEETLLKKYKDDNKAKGLRVHYPAEDTEQEDPTGGYRICKDHFYEIVNSNEIHVYWVKSSMGSHVDLGTALSNHYGHGRNIRLINRKIVEDIVTEYEKNNIYKSYEHVLLELDDLANSKTQTL